jgi:glycerol kinase
VTRSVAVQAIVDAGIQGAELDAIGITNQRETVVAWDPATGEPIHRALVWQDRRTAERCEELRAAGHEPLVRERTGLVLDPYFSGTKIEWLLRNVAGAERAAFGTVDSWLLFKLTGRHATDQTNASRTMLFDIRRLAWDEELCALLGVDPEQLPEPLPSAHVYGTTSEFGGEVPVAGIAGDQQAALFGQACHQPGTAKNTYGTGSFVLLNTGPEAPDPVDGLLATVACTIDDGRRDSGSTISSLSGPSAGGSYALEASIFVTGAAVQWLRDGLGLIEGAGESEALAASLDGNDGVYFVPALTGLGSPHWDPYARGTIVGLTRGSGRAHLARAALEAIAYQTVDAVRAQEAASGERLAVLKADGGAVANGWLMQFQADVLGAEVSVPEIAETTALGAAYLAGIAIGRWTMEQVGEMWREAARYEPAMGAGEREALLGQWHRALERSKGWAEPANESA